MARQKGRGVAIFTKESRVRSAVACQVVETYKLRTVRMVTVS
jgi:hypothetical protein